MDNEKVLSNEELLHIIGGDSFLLNQNYCDNHHRVIEPPYGLPDPRFFDAK